MSSKNSERLAAVLAEIDARSGSVLGRSNVVESDRDEFVYPAAIGGPRPAGQFLIKYADDLEEGQGYVAELPFHPLDAAIGLLSYLEDRFGAVVVGEATHVTVDLGGGRSTEAVINTWLTPPPQVALKLRVRPSPGRPTTTLLQGHGPASKAGRWSKIVEELTAWLSARSIYKGRAWTGPAEAPRFLDLEGFDPASIVYSARASEDLDSFLWGPIVLADERANLGQAVRSSILLHGEFGTGKTKCAEITAQLCERFGVTFCAVRPGVDDFSQVLEMAANYAPSVVFAEDADALTGATGIGQDVEVSRMLDLLDGLESKTERDKVVLVVTSNDPTKLYAGLLRPGRFDHEVEIGRPDAAAIRGILSHRLGREIAGTFTENDWLAVTDAMHGYLPAFVAAAADKALSYTATRLAREAGICFRTADPDDEIPAGLADDVRASLGAADVVSAADHLRSHLALMERALANGRAKPPTIDELVAAACAEATGAVDAVDPDYVYDRAYEGAESGSENGLSNVADDIVTEARDGAYNGAYEAVNEARY